MVWERLSATPGLTDRGSTGSLDGCYYGQPAMYTGLDAPGRNPRAARTPRGSVCCLRTGDPAHHCDRGIVYAGATAVAAFASVAYPCLRISAGAAGRR